VKVGARRLLRQVSAAIMNRERQSIVIGIPAIGLCILAFVLIGRSFLPLGGGLNEVVFYLETLQIFTVPMNVWLPLAFLSYGIGYALFRRCLRKDSGVGQLVLSEAIMCVPLCITVLLFTVGEYVGP
jgi:hypothetical protein